VLYNFRQLWVYFMYTILIIIPFTRGNTFELSKRRYVFLISHFMANIKAIELIYIYGSKKYNYLNDYSFFSAKIYYLYIFLI